MRHQGSSGNYISIDGSAHTLRSSSGVGPQCQGWTTQHSGGGIVNLGVANDYGGW